MLLHRIGVPSFRGNPRSVLGELFISENSNKIQNSNFESPARVRRRAGRAHRLGMTCSAGRGCAGVMGVIDDDYH